MRSLYCLGVISKTFTINELLKDNSLNAKKVSDTQNFEYCSYSIFSRHLVRFSIYAYNIWSESFCIKAVLLKNVRWFTCGSFVPQTLFFLLHVISEQVTFSAGFDTAPIRRVGIFCLPFSLTVFQAAGVPTYADFEMAVAGLPHFFGTSAHFDVFLRCCTNFVFGRAMLGSR